MITQSLQTVVGEVTELWAWMIGIVAGWGLTFTLVVAALVYAHIRIAKLQKELDNVRNYLVSESRDLSLRIRKLEK